MTIKRVSSLKQAMPKLMFREKKYHQELYYNEADAMKAAKAMEQLTKKTVYVEPPSGKSKLWWVYHEI